MTGVEGLNRDISKARYSTKEGGLQGGFTVDDTLVNTLMDPEKAYTETVKQVVNGLNDAKKTADLIYDESGKVVEKTGNYVDVGEFGLNKDSDVIAAKLEQKYNVDLENKGIEDASELKGLCVTSEDGQLIKISPSGELSAVPFQAGGVRDQLLYPLDMAPDYKITENNQEKIISSIDNGYIDFNVSGGYIGGVTFGLVISNNGNVHLYAGGGLMTPGVSGAVTVSTSEASSGWNVGLQGQNGLAGQVGYSFSNNGSWFGEIGGGGPAGVSLSGYYIFNPSGNLLKDNNKLIKMDKK